jgi:hypothetical protein
MKAREPFGLKLISILPEWAISGSAYYFFFVVIVIRHETTTAARWASSLLIVRTFTPSPLQSGQVFTVRLPVDTSASSFHYAATPVRVRSQGEPI